MVKRAIAEVSGLIVHWIDKDPLGAFNPTGKMVVTHTNPVYRLRAMKILRTAMLWFVYQQRLHWRMDVCLVFLRGDKYERVELSVDEVATVDEINDHIIPEIELALKEAEDGGYADCYLHTEFKLHCLGLDSAHSKTA